MAIATTDSPGQLLHDRDGNSERRTQISAVAVSRAYFNAATDNDKQTYVMLPPEDLDHKDKCGLLRKHMYGTRAAADGWQQEYSGFLRSIGFRQGVACPCLFVNSDRQLAVSVHGDDFTTAGPKCEIDWFEKVLEEKYELKKGGRLGPGPNDTKQLTVLNRVLRWVDGGVEYEADPRQGERLLEGLGLDVDNCKSMATPGQKLEIDKLKEDKPLSQDEHTTFRVRHLKNLMYLMNLKSLKYLHHLRHLKSLMYLMNLKSLRFLSCLKSLRCLHHHLWNLLHKDL